MIGNAREGGVGVRAYRERKWKGRVRVILLLCTMAELWCIMIAALMSLYRVGVVKMRLLGIVNYSCEFLKWLLESEDW